jgi:hypothetical protein
MIKINNGIAVALAACFAVMFAIGCGPSREEAEEVLQEAKNGLRSLEEDSASSAETLLSRTMVRKAENEITDGDYGDAYDHAREAATDAREMMRLRMRSRNNLSQRLDIATEKFFSVVYPRPALVNAFFDAKDAYARRDYITVMDKMGIFDKNYKLDRAFELHAEIELSYPSGSGAAQDMRIPIYSDLTEAGALINNIAMIPNRYKARFLRSVWFSRDIRFIRIEFDIMTEDNQQSLFGADPSNMVTTTNTYEGWIENKFLAR